MATIAEELLGLLGKLPMEQQQRVLEYARELSRPRPAPRSPLPPGKPVSELLNWRPTMTPEEVETMRQAIEEDCETIEPDER